MNGVAALFLFIAAYDTQALVRGTPTITHDFRALLQEHPGPVIFGTAYILAHLYNRPRWFRYVDVLNGYSVAWQSIAR